MCWVSAVQAAIQEKKQRRLEVTPVARLAYPFEGTPYQATPDDVSRALASHNRFLASQSHSGHTRQTSAVYTELPSRRLINHAPHYRGTGRWGVVKGAFALAVSSS